MEKIKKDKKLIEALDFKKVEEIHKIIFPEDYKVHMLKYNGGRPVSKLFFKPDIWDDEIKLSYLLPLKYGSYTFERANLKGELLDYPEENLIIGHTLTGALSISFKESEYGSIYVFYSDGEMHKLANSFTEFLEGLKEL